MLALPSYMILDFFDWVNENTSSSLNMGYVRECVFRGRHNSDAFDDLDSYAEEFITQQKLNFEPWELVESLRYYIVYGSHEENDRKEKEKIENALWAYDKNEIYICDSDNLIHAMVATKEMSLEIEFLEWLLENRLHESDILKMPFSRFKELANDYLQQKYSSGNNEARLNDLIKLFKIDNPITLFDRISINLSKKDREKHKNLHYLYDRYSSPKLFKCFFLPLAADKEFPSFIGDYWTDLHTLSADYLDIYYSTEELHNSGYKITEQFKKLDVPVNSLPCLVLWKNNINKACFIEIRDLSNSEIFHIIQGIVLNIKAGKDFHSIYEEATKMADKKRKSHSPATYVNVTQTVESVTGVIAGIVTDSTVIVDANSATIGENFSKELDDAITRINAMIELDKNQKEYLSSIMNDAKTATDASKKESCKNKFEAFMQGVGKVSEKVLSVLANLATVAAFFGFGL